MLRRFVLAAVMLVAVAGTAVALLRTPEQRDSTGTGGSSERSLGSVRGITLEAFAGTSVVDLESNRGKPLVINYWASWCLFCIDEMPDFQEVYEEVADRVEFLGVNIKDDSAAAQTLVDETGVRYPLAADDDGSVYRKLGGFSMPTTLFVGEEGQILERFSGPLDADQLRALIKNHFDV
ncbi:MAG: TlpA disulfide reductase family protein [Actinomycetota bacterium]